MKGDGRMKTTWIRGPRMYVTSRDRNGNEQTMKGKNGGPLVKQDVMKVIEPRGGR